MERTARAAGLLADAATVTARNGAPGGSAGDQAARVTDTDEAGICPGDRLTSVGSAPGILVSCQLGNLPDRTHVRRPAPPLLYFPAVLAIRSVRISLLTSGAKRLEPLTSCMPSGGSMSTCVSLCRSPSSRVPASAQVAVLPAVPLPSPPNTPAATQMQPDQRQLLYIRLQVRAAQRTADLIGQAGQARLPALPQPLPHTRPCQPAATGRSRTIRQPSSPGTPGEISQQRPVLPN